MKLPRRLAVWVLPCLLAIFGCTVLDPTSPALLEVQTASLPNGLENVPYAPQTLNAVGGDGQREWTLLSGSLPSGLALSASGEITGTPEVAGTSTFTVRVTSRDGQSAQRVLAITVYGPLAVTTSSLPGAVRNVAYGPLPLGATGGSGSNQWTVVSGSLPSGIHLSASGELTGYPLLDGASAFTVRVASSDGQLAEQALGITVTTILAATTTSLPYGVAGVSYGPEALGATGGDGSVQWTVVSGSLPEGLALSLGGEITGTPSAVGISAFTVQVSSGDGQTAQRALAITVYAPLVVTTSSLPVGPRNVAYGPLTIGATGGGGSNRWRVVAGSLPTGIQLSTNGVLSGTPTVAGTRNFTVQVTSGNGQVAERALEINVTSLLTVTTATLPYGVEGVSYAPQTLAAAGGFGSNQWTVVSGSLPTGLALSTAGEITGTPSVVGSSAFTVRATSGDGQTAERALAITVYAPLVVTTTSLPDGMEEVAYGPVTLQASGGNGVNSWQVVAGTLPVGLGLSSAGVITGAPEAVGIANFTVQVTSGNGQVDQQALAIDVREFLAITTTTLPFAIEDAPYGPETLNAVGGGAGDVWSVVVGALPSGLTLSGDGEISGTPTAPGTAGFTVQVATLDGRTAQRVLSIDVHETLVVTTTSLPVAVANVDYGPETLVATGGSGANTWTVLSGLPSGLALAANGELFGTPVVVGTQDLTVQVTNADGQTAQRVIPFTVAPQPVLLASESCADFPPYALPTFEDANLETAVRAALGLGVGEQLTCAVAAGLTTLDQANGANAGITSLVGIQNLVGVETLWLASNSITDIGPLATLPVVDEIHLQHNAIVDVSPVAGLTTLTFLSFWDNEIVDITPLAGLTGLTFLQVAENQITDVSALQGLTNLVILRVYLNPNLIDITPLLNNLGLGAGDELRINSTQVACAPLATLVQRGVSVYSDFDPTALVPWDELCS